ncbi:hypothetical protein [Aureibacter tunicatorum]|uniref:Uncharacterized protein n=1 Tax=Aureibacter tunicatorum TaxID=866807 RepID=A0AAE3XKG7_9BACT|nr:hypothetical protein [Aureibacter tunicatorum]MDR6237653.1 hypothetical protein [Aureibacter tunicatorum]BDD02688.1 hypothetical protein AUTU_01710 [Aureibacter tunicatorum]
MIATNDLIKYSEKYLSDELVSKSSMNAIKKVAGDVPAIFHTLYFEVRICDNTRVDLIGMATKKRIGSQGDAMKKWLNSSHYSILDKWMSNEVLPQLCCFEFDIVNHELDRTLMFWALEHGYFDRQMFHNNNKAYTMKALHECFKIEGINPTSDVLVNLKDCISKMPSSANLLHTLNMSYRGTEGQRLIISLPVSECLSFLKNISWEGNSVLLKTVVNLLMEYHFNISLQLTFDPSLNESIGLEVYSRNSKDSSESIKSFNLFFNDLQRENLLLSDKLDLAAKWIGEDTINDDSVAWKMGIVRDLTFKLIIGKKVSLDAKMYLGVNAFYKLF